MEQGPDKSKAAAAMLVAKLKPNHDSGIEGSETGEDAEHESMCGEDILSAISSKDPAALAKAIKALSGY